MNKYRKITMNRMQTPRQQGFTLLDVLLAILVFVVGMLALAHLQTNLTRSATDANARTLATNIGEEIIERLRSFERVHTDPDGAVFAYADIADSYIDGIYGTETRGGLNFAITGNVLGFDFDDDNVSLVEADGVEAVAGTVYDFKQVDLTISWDAAGDFQIDEENTVASSDLGSGQITLTGIIPSTSNKAGALIVAGDEDDGPVTVQFDPGENPDIIRLDLTTNGDNDRFKESTTPMPDVIRQNELVETWFDVITYNGLSPATFSRREEFLVVSCVCELAEPSGSELTGYLPTVWNGNEYETLGGNEMVSKMYGVSASNQQSAYCSTCCRDHHDSSGQVQFDPEREWTADGDNGDHAHYSRITNGPNAGDWQVAEVGDEYLESCRMVRKDGFMRVAQDFRQEGFVAFPEGFLETADGAGEYSDYVEAAVRSFYDSDWDPDVFPLPTEVADIDFPADNMTGTGVSDDTDRTTLPFNGNAALLSQQMRSRGIYIDRVKNGSLLEGILTCMVRDGGTGDDCGAPGVDDWLEVLPFFEVQMTWLSWWEEDSDGTVMNVTSEALETDNSHSRGLAVLTDTDAPATFVTVTTDVHRGNIGLAVTDPIGPRDLRTAGFAWTDYEMYVDVNGADGDAPNPAGNYWSGTLVSAVGGVNATNVVLDWDSNSHCSRSGTALSCITSFSAASGSLTITGYYKNANTQLWVCAPGSESYFENPIANSPSGPNKEATLTWPTGSDRQGVTLVIQSQACADPAG